MTESFILPQFKGSTDNPTV